MKIIKMNKMQSVLPLPELEESVEKISEKERIIGIKKTYEMK